MATTDDHIQWDDSERGYNDQSIRRAEAQAQRAREREITENPIFRVPEPEPSPQVGTTTTTWTEQATIGAADIHAIQDSPGNIVATDSTAGNQLYSYASNALTKEDVKDVVREVMKEFMEERDDFMGWLQMKYTALEMQKKPKKKRKRRASRLQPPAPPQPQYITTSVNQATGNLNVTLASVDNGEGYVTGGTIT